jgi:axial budding pattern protein 2
MDNEATLIVSTEPKPELKKPPARIVAGIEPSDDMSGLLFPPNTDFNIQFPSDLFVPVTAQQRYHAVSADNLPLPSWLWFDPTERKFTGTTLSRAASPQSFGVKFVRTDLTGFVGNSLDFRIVVGLMYFDDAYVSLKASAGRRFTYQVSRESLKSDDQQITPATIQSVPFVWST